MVDVVLQMGHVARRTGATGCPGEQAYSRGVVTRAEALIAELGVTVRTIGADPPSASAYRGELFFAVHYDSSSSATARGASVGHTTVEGRKLAEAWKQAYQRRGFSGGFRADNYTAALSGYYGVRRAVAQGCRRAVILEGGFGSHPTEGAWLRSAEGMTCNAWAIRDAVAAVLGTASSTKGKTQKASSTKGKTQKASSTKGKTQTAGAVAATSRTSEEDEMTLARGHKGRAVRLFQKALVAEAKAARRPDPLPKSGADGDFGPETEAAVKSFQKAAQVPEVSGRIDGVTAALLARHAPTR